MNLVYLIVKVESWKTVSVFEINLALRYISSDVGRS